MLILVTVFPRKHWGLTYNLGLDDYGEKKKIIITNNNIKILIIKNNNSLIWKHMHLQNH